MDKLTPSEIQTLLKEWVIKNVANKRQNYVLINELCFINKKRRADLVLAGESISAFEIKSEADNLIRWMEQEKSYYQVFDEIWLCCHVKHSIKALQVSKPNTGIIIIDNFNNMAALRLPKTNKRVNIESLMYFLWKVDIQKMLKANNIFFKSSQNIKSLRQLAKSKLSQEKIKEFIILSIKKRYST